MLIKITHLFRISRPLELKYSQAGNAFGNVGLVCSEKYKDKETVLWVNATAFGKTAELISNMPKGAQIFVEGKLSTDEWMDQQGAKKSKTVLTIDRFEFVDPKPQESTQGAYSQPNGNNAGAYGGAAAQGAYGGAGGNPQYQQQQQAAPNNSMSRPPQTQDPKNNGQQMYDAQGNPIPVVMYDANGEVIPF